MGGFSSFKAFTGGAVAGIESAEAAKQAKQNKIDDENREMALKVSAEKEMNQSKLDQQQKMDELAAAKIHAMNVAKTTENVATTADATNSATSQAQAPVAPTVQGAQPATMPDASSVALPDAQQPAQAGTAPAAAPMQTPMPQANAQPAQQPTEVSQVQSLPRVNATSKDWQGSQERERAAMAHYKAGLPIEAAFYTADKEHEKSTRDATSEAANTEYKKLETKKLQRELGDTADPDGVHNKYGLVIGEVPEGMNAPVLSDQVLSRKTPTAMAADEKQLRIDEEAAQRAGDTATEFSRYLTANKTADSAGLNKIGFFRDITASLSSTDATADSINKELTFGMAATERPPGMRLTQQEFMIMREATASRSNTPEANRNIAAYWNAKLQTPQEWAEFKRDFMAVNGSWDEAKGRVIFDRYQKDNPIFDPKVLAHPEQAKLSNYSLNPNRLTMAQYIKSGGLGNLSAFGMPSGSSMPESTSGTPDNNAPKNDPLGLFK